MSQLHKFLLKMSNVRIAPSPLGLSCYSEIVDLLRACFRVIPLPYGVFRMSNFYLELVGKVTSKVSAEILQVFWLNIVQLQGKCFILHVWL